MKAKQNTTSIAAAAALFILALILENAIRSIKLYVGPTLDIQTGLWGYMGIAMLFSASIFVFFLVAYKYQPADRWVYACFLVFAAVLVILYVLTYMTPLEFLANMRNFRISMALFAPGSLPGIATMTLLWAGIGGIMLSTKK